MSYPSWRYNYDLGAKLILSAEEDKALGDDWSDNPGNVGLIPYVAPGGMAFEKDPNYSAKPPKDEKPKARRVKQ